MTKVEFIEYLVLRMAEKVINDNKTGKIDQFVKKHRKIFIVFLFDVQLITTKEFYGFCLIYRGPTTEHIYYNTLISVEYHNYGIIL